MNKKNCCLKTVVVLLAIMLFISGCGTTAPDGSDFKNVVYKIDVNKNTQSDPSDESEDNNLPDVGKNENSASTVDKSDFASSETDSSSDNTENENKNTDPTYVENWPELLNPNGFNINSVQNVHKFSCVDGRLTVSTFLPNVAYLENGVAKDTMFDGFAFMGSNTFFYDYGNEDGGKKAMTKKDWMNYIYTYEFREGYNVDALENAVGQVKNALEMPEYKAGVFLCISAPVKRVTNWGELNGKTLNFSESDEDRVEALKWFVDEQIKVFNERDYQNIELCGFYYYHETCSEEDKAYLPAITDYVRSKGYITVWSPYYLAKGYDKWQEFGFDRVAMQANYFAGREDLPNAGGKVNVTNAAAITAKRGMGFEMEICGIKPENVAGIKEYFRVGIQTGFMHRYHTWWMASGLSTAKSLSNSADPYVQSTYKEMYLFIKNKLQISDITFE